MKKTYRDWLGIPEDRQPPTPSQLLGVAEGERDLTILENAALDRMALARSRQLSNPEESTWLQNEIARALGTLTERSRRRQPSSSVALDAELGLSVLVLCQQKRDRADGFATFWKVTLEQVVPDDGQRSSLARRLQDRVPSGSAARARILRHHRSGLTHQTELVVVLELPRLPWNCHHNVRSPGSGIASRGGVEAQG
jgi:hypothetical protein